MTDQTFPTREPIVTTAGITAAVTAVIALLVALGVPISSDMQVAILGVVAVAAPLVVIYARRWTVPAGAVLEHVDADGTVIAGEASPLPTGTPIGTAENDPLGADAPEDVEGGLSE